MTTCRVLLSRTVPTEENSFTSGFDFGGGTHISLMFQVAGSLDFGHVAKVSQSSSHRETGAPVKQFSWVFPPSPQTGSRLTVCVQ